MEEFYFTIAFRWSECNSLDFYSFHNSQILFGTMDDAREYLNKANRNGSNEYFINRITFDPIKVISE